MTKGFFISILLTVLIFFSTIPYSRAEYKYTEACQQALLNIYDLKMDDARSILKAALAKTPNNYYLYVLEHYCDAMELIITEDEALYEKFKDEWERKRDIMDEKDEDSPYYKLFEAEMMYTVGLMDIKYGGRLSGVSKLFSAYKLIKRNVEGHPDFWPNDRLYGIFNVAFSNLPPAVGWIAKLFGVKGDLDLGMKQLDNYYKQSKSYPGLDAEAVIYKILGYKLTWNNKKGYEFLATLPPELLEITLVKYLYANLSSFGGENDHAIDVLMSIDPTVLQIKFYALDYQLGKCKFKRLDDDANQYLLRYLNQFSGTSYKKEMCNMLSQYYLIHGNKTQYERYRNKLDDFDGDFRDRDREAEVDVSFELIPNVELLKARILLLGAYDDRVEAILSNIQYSSLGELPYKLEYRFLNARIAQRKGNLESAKRTFEKVLDEGEDEDYPFATESALHLGFIYESQKNYPKARFYYDLCLDLFDDDYVYENVERQAESGIDRVAKYLN